MSSKGFLDRNKEENTSSPFAKKAKTPDTKVVKINADLHYILKANVGLSNNGMNITDHINKAVEEYIKKQELDKFVEKYNK